MRAGHRRRMKKGMTRFVMIMPTMMVLTADTKNASQCANGAEPSRRVSIECVNERHRSLKTEAVIGFLLTAAALPV